MLQDIELVEIIKSKSISTDFTEKREADKAFKKLFNKYENGLRFSVMSKVSDAEDVADITMMTFEKIHKNIHMYNAQCGAFSTWLYAIFNNLFIDYLRKKREGVISLSELVRSNEEGEDVPYTLPTGDKTIEEDIAQKEVSIAVKMIVEEMESSFYKDLIVMKYFKDMAYEEIAEELGKPMGTIKASLFRAKEELKKRIKNNSLFL